MKIIEMTGKTVDEALKNALKELNLTEDKVEFEVLEEGSKGLFNLIGTKPAKIKVIVKRDPTLENYRNKREETLKRVAQKTAYKVKKTGRPYKLEPMNPYERRIIHSALQSYNDINTYSEGEEPFRRIVVSLKR